MPDMDGIQLIDWIRTRQASDYIYTILMTSLDQEQDCVKGLSCGADDFLTKPASPSVLYARLSVAMRILSIQQDLLAQQEQLRESRDLVTRAYARVQEDLKGASAAQRSLLPVSGTTFHRGGNCVVLSAGHGGFQVIAWIYSQSVKGNWSSTCWTYQATVSRLLCVRQLSAS